MRNKCLACSDAFNSVHDIALCFGAGYVRAGVAVAAVSESYYQPRVFKVVGGHLAPPTGTMARVHLRRQESEEFGCV